MREEEKKTEKCKTRHRRKKASALKRITGRILHYLLLLIFCLLIGYSLYSLNSEKILGNSMPMPFGFGFAAVMSGSMEPALDIGDLVIVRRYDSAAASADDSLRQLETGDIIVYESETGRSLVIHRIIGFTDEHQVITKGDANNAEDEPVTPDRIKGVFIRRIPGVGSIMLALKQPVCIICLIIMAILSMEMSLISEKKEKQEELDALQEEINKLREEQEEDTRHRD